MVNQLDETQYLLISSIPGPDLQGRAPKVTPPMVPWSKIAALRWFEQSPAWYPALSCCFCWCLQTTLTSDVNPICVALIRSVAPLHYLSKPDNVFDLVVDLWEKLCCPYSHPEFAAKAKIKHHSGELLVIVGAYQVSILLWNSCSSFFHIQVKTNAHRSQDLKVKSCQNCVIKHVKTVLKPWNKH